MGVCLGVSEASAWRMDVHIAAARAGPRASREAAFPGGACGASCILASRGPWVVLAPRSIIPNKPLTGISSLDTSETGLPL